MKRWEGGVDHAVNTEYLPICTTAMPLQRVLQITRNRAWVLITLVRFLRFGPVALNQFLVRSGSRCCKRTARRKSRVRHAVKFEYDRDARIHRAFAIIKRSIERLKYFPSVQLLFSEAANRCLGSPFCPSSSG